MTTRASKRSLRTVVITLLFAFSIAESESIAQKQNERKFLVDIPGVGYSGAKRHGDWGNLLNADKETVYIRHEGRLGLHDWVAQPDNVNIVTLPNKWDPASADRLLLPIIQP